MIFRGTIKRRLGLLLVWCMLLCGCGAAQAEPESQTDAGKREEETEVLEPSLEEDITELGVLETPVRQYGESAAFIQMEGHLLVHILYPEGEYVELNQAIEEWAHDTAAYYQRDMADSNTEDCGELMAEYDSYRIGERFVSVKMTGVFDRPYLAHPIDVAATFTVDAGTGEVVKLEDILQPDTMKVLQQMVVKSAGLAQEDLDEHLLDLWLLTPEGLEITLRRGDYLPMSAGTMTLRYSYEELDGIFNRKENGEAEGAGESKEQAEPGMPQESTESDIPDPAKPMLALTFDDGPSGHTERLLDIFAQHGGKGTFFVLGNLIDDRAATVKRIAEEGHEVGGHSWNHRQLTKLSTEEIKEQIINTQAKIYDVTGVNSQVLRPPYGSYNDEVKSIAAEQGIVIVNWSVDTLDWKYKDADYVYRAIMEDAQDGAIILCHDLQKTTVDAMERVIPDLIAQGYQLVTVSELLSCGEEPVSAGNVYKKR